MLQAKIANIYNVNMLLCVETIVDISNLCLATPQYYIPWKSIVLRT